ncbi:MAG: malate dehydrogenase [Thiotrichaceae bacterium]
MDKITIIGAGRVGESTAQFLAQRRLCKVLALLDVRDGAAAGAALDVQEAAPLFGYDTRVIGSDKPEIMADSGLVIITAGIPRKPGMSRSDVVDTNLAIIDSIMDDVIEYAPDSIVIVVSNPVDFLTYYAWKKTGWHRSRVMGQAGVLDSSRMAAFVALETTFSVKNINAMVLGGHGDAMVPMTRFTTISGIPIEHFLDQEAIDRIVERSRNGGAEILSLRKNSSAYDAPAAAIAEMVEAIVLDRRQVLPVVAILEGEYDQRDLAMGVPCVLSEEGMDRIIELPLNDTEKSMFEETILSIKNDLKRLK